jgi:hypothetical protein
MRDRRCHASVETIGKALAGNYRVEHLSALEQGKREFPCTFCF